jgi:hypothetical protein
MNQMTIRKPPRSTGSSYLHGIGGFLPLEEPGFVFRVEPHLWVDIANSVLELLGMAVTIWLSPYRVRGGKREVKTASWPWETAPRLSVAFKSEASARLGLLLPSTADIEVARLSQPAPIA